MTSLNYNESSNSFQSYEPFSFLVSVNLTPSIYGFSFPLSANYSKMNKSFNHPFYRFGISPTYKWVKLNLGHRSTNFSKYSVSGQKSFGAGIELTPGKFRIGFMYGKFRREKGFSTINPYDDFDQNDYSRKGYAAKLGYGTTKNFVDVVFMRIADNMDDYANNTLNINPESNVIASAITKFSLGKHFAFNAEVAASVITENMFANPSEPEDIPNMLQGFENYFNINSSSNVAMANEFGINYNIKTFTVGLQYQRVDPEYRSLGTYFIRNDFENYTLNSSYRFKKGIISGSLGILKDNLKNTKIAQTNRVVSRLNLSLNPTKVFSVNANYSNFSAKQTEGRLPLNDTIKLYQVNKNISISPQLRFVNENNSSIIMANYTYADMNDKNAFAQYAVPVVSNTAFVQYNYNLTKRGLGASANINYTDFKANIAHITSIGPTVSANKTMLKNKGTLMLSCSYLWSENNAVKGNVISGRTSFKYKISKKQQIKLNYFITKSNYPDNANVMAYNNSRGVLAYTYQF